MTKIIPLVRELVFHARSGASGGKLIEVKAPLQELAWKMVNVSPGWRKSETFVTASVPPKVIELRPRMESLVCVVLLTARIVVPARVRELLMVSAPMEEEAAFYRVRGLPPVE